jgi:hypothetical protein
VHPCEAGPAALMAAAARLRAAPPVGAHCRTDVRSATARLLQQLAASLAHDDAGLPPYVRRAALALATQVLAADRPETQGSSPASDVPLPRSSPWHRSVTTPAAPGRVR